MRVAMVGLRGIDEESPSGGIESVVAALAPRLAARGHEILIYTRRRYTTPALPRPPGLTVHPLPTLYTPHLETLLYTFLSQLRRDAVDVMHFHALGPALLAPMARLRGIPVVATVHGLDFERPKWGRFARWALRLGASSAAFFPQATTVVSKALQDYFHHNHQCLTDFIPNGVELPENETSLPLSRLGITPGYVLFLGRLVEDKGVELLIRAWRKEKRSWQLIIAGEINKKSSYCHILQKMASYDDSIRFIGQVRGRLKRALLQHAAAFVLPSRIEGLSMALLEAMAAGCPPIVSDVSGNLEVIEEEDGGKAGVVFPVGSVDGLCRALAWMQAHPEARKGLGKRARDLVMAKYSWDEVVKAYEDVYHRAVRVSRKGVLNLA